MPHIAVFLGPYLAAMMPPGTWNIPIPIMKLAETIPSNEISCLKSDAIREKIEAILNQLMAYIILENNKDKTAAR
jgi:hypothetical protein